MVIRSKWSCFFLIIFDGATLKQPLLSPCEDQLHLGSWLMTVSGLHRNAGMIPGLRSGLPSWRHTTDKCRYTFSFVNTCQGFTTGISSFVLKLLTAASLEALSSEGDYCQKQGVVLGHHHLTHHTFRTSSQVYVLHQLCRAMGSVLPSPHGGPQGTSWVAGECMRYHSITLLPLAFWHDGSY